VLELEDIISVLSELRELEDIISELSELRELEDIISVLEELEDSLELLLELLLISVLELELTEELLISSSWAKG
jgi:hypothetical protein